MAFERLYSYFARDLFRYGYRVCTNTELVQDSIQDLFLHLWNKRSDLKEVASPRFYLYRSLRNKLIRSSESDRFVFSTDGDLEDNWFPSEKDIESNWIIDESNRIQLAQLHEALQKLPVRQQEAIQLRYYHDFSAEEIGRIMNINQQSVRNLQNRAMQQLRAELPFFPVSLLSIVFCL
jgi:RNA polymerase sigma factor (sigma-70 family)